MATATTAIPLGLINTQHNVTSTTYAHHQQKVSNSNSIADSIAAVAANLQQQTQSLQQQNKTISSPATAAAASLAINYSCTYCTFGADKLKKMSDHLKQQHAHREKTCMDNVRQQLIRLPNEDLPAHNQNPPTVGSLLNMHHQQQLQQQYHQQIQHNEPQQHQQPQPHQPQPLQQGKIKSLIILKLEKKNFISTLMKK